MEFLNGIVEKLAPIHEKILDLTNPLTLTIEEYVPQLTSVISDAVPKRLNSGDENVVTF